jgi:uncharacterized membrane protein
LEAEGAEARLDRLDRVAMWLSRRTGDPHLFAVLACATVGWTVWNGFDPKVWRFDPAPSFPILMGLSKVIQRCLLPVLLIGQNLESRRARLRAEQMRHAMLKDAEDTAQVLERLERLEKRLEGMPPTAS